MALLFADREMAPTLERIEPREPNIDGYAHTLPINGTRAVLDGYGPGGLVCINHYRCLDDSMFAKAMRLLRINESQEDGETVYMHMDTGSIIPGSEISRVTQLVQERQ